MTRMIPPPNSEGETRSRLVIVEDDPGFAADLVDWLHADSGFRVVAHYTTAEQALQGLTIVKPHLAVVDLNLPEMGGVELIRRLKRLMAELTCVVLTQFSDSDLIFGALAAGADSYLLKGDAPGRILESIRDADQGGSVMSPSIGRKVFDFFQAPGVPAEIRAALSPRQIEILQLAKRGKNTKGIALALHLSSETVRTHFRNIYRALQVHSLNQALDRTFPSGG